MRSIEKFTNNDNINDINDDNNVEDDLNKINDLVNNIDTN